jgi:V/A-type H+-transporting ATPase subunit C
MQMRERIYPHANTIVCIEDTKLLKRFQYDILYNCNGIDATLAELNGINYFHTHLHADAGNYGSMLEGVTKTMFDLMRAITGEIPQGDLICRLFTLNYDIHNLKLVVKERFWNKRFDDLAIEYGTYSLRTIRSAAVRESDNILGNETLTAGFFKALRAKDIYGVDFILDKVYFQTLKKIAEKMDCPGIVDFVIERIDLFNMSALIQSMAVRTTDWYFEKAFSEDGSLPFSEWSFYVDTIVGGNQDQIASFGLWQKYSVIWDAAADRRQLFSEFDVLVDNYLIAKTTACKLMVFGIEPICAYFYNKLMEIKNIRILLTGKENGYDVEEIKKRMRIPYEL